MTYKDRQKEIQKSYFKNHKLGGKYRNREYDFILKNSEDNFVDTSCFEKVSAYFKENNISWWGGKNPTTHTLSSQIACINHLFPIRKDRDAVLALAHSVDPDFDDVEIISNDNFEKGYISFEVVSSKDYLNEIKGKNKIPHRGNQCTSIDAVILAKKQEKRVLLVIEWKYVELYGNEDKSKSPKGKRCGETRLNRYQDLIEKSKQLKSVDNCRGSVYFHEPFYQLMRQTLWAEQMVDPENVDAIRADDYIHVHVVPMGNNELLHKRYPCSKGKDMFTTWKSQLKDPQKYVLIDPAEFFSKLSCEKWKDLICYLKARYWQ